MAIEPFSNGDLSISVHQETPWTLEMRSAKFAVALRQETPLIHETFSGAKVKLKRADEHIANLKAVLNSLVFTDFYRRTVRYDTASGNYILEVRCIADPPDSIALIIGDAVHALRSALDHLMWEMVSLAGMTPDNNLYFPIRKTRKKFREAMRDPQIQAVGADILNLICNVIKPYPEGNKLLCALAELDIIDKHKLLIPVFPVAIFGEDENPDRVNSIRSSMLIPKGFVWSIDAHSSEPLEINNNIKTTLCITFGNGQPFEDEEVIPILQSLSQLVAGIIQDVEDTYRARK